MHNKLEVCKSMRTMVADCLYETLDELLKQKEPFSEVQVREKWLKKIREHKNVFPDGWYTPPPHGAVILFGTDEDVKRVSPMSMRPQENWPKENVYFDRMKGIMFAYFSAVDKTTGIIGDFGMSIYVGNNQLIKDHLIRCLELDKQIFDYAQIGMSLSDIVSFTNKLYLQYGLTNVIASRSDPTGTNYGHTLPASYENWSEKELIILKSGDHDWQAVVNMINKKRKFINAQETLKIKPGLAMTIEPCPIVLHHPNIPMVYFHTIILFKEDGSKELLTNFDKIFQLVSMNYMFEQNIMKV